MFELPPTSFLMARHFLLMVLLHVVASRLQLLILTTANHSAMMFFCRSAGGRPTNTQTAPRKKHGKSEASAVF